MLNMDDLRESMDELQRETRRIAKEMGIDVDDIEEISIDEMLGRLDDMNEELDSREM